jgi:hypothetical protein
MRIKVNDIWYDGEVQPIMVQLTENDKKNILVMPTECTRYAEFPDTYSKEDIKKWMEL